jgi:hypothetical protein
LNHLRIVCAVAVASVALVAFATACGGEVLPIGNDALTPLSEDAGRDVTTDDDAQPVSEGGRDASSAPYDSGPISPLDASDLYDSYAQYDVWDYDAANWPSVATLGCATNGDECSCAYAVAGHDYAFRCSEVTATCDCLVDSVVQSTELDDSVCAASDASVSPMQIQWIIGCAFPQ